MQEECEKCPFHNHYGGFCNITDASPSEWDINENKDIKYFNQEEINQEGVRNMGEENKNTGELYFRVKENWFKELLIRLKILKPKYKKLGECRVISFTEEEK